MKRNEGFEVKLASSHNFYIRRRWVVVFASSWPVYPRTRTPFTIRIGDDVRDQSKTGLSKGEGNISICLEM